MTQLEHLTDIVDLDIKSLDEIIAESPRPSCYKRFHEIEDELIEKGIAPSLPAYLLYEYQFKGKTTDELDKEFNENKGTFYWLLRKLRIPLKSISESMRGNIIPEDVRKRIGDAQRGSKHHNYGNKLSEDHKKKIGDGNKGKRVTEETRRKISKLKKGRKNHFYGKTLSLEHRKKLSEAQTGRTHTYETRMKLRKNGLKTNFILRKQKYPFGGNYYDSQSEAATGVLLERYIPGFKIEEGKTFQVNPQISKSIDFLVKDSFVEWHPILPFKSKNKLGDIPNLEEYGSFKKVRAELMDEERKDFDKDYKQILAIAYRSSREAAIAQSPTYRNHDLILVQSPGELYDSVITRFGSNYPSRSEFIREFNQVKKQVKEANKK